MSLTARFLLLRVSVFLILGALFLLTFDMLVDRINRQWGQEFAQRQVLFDQYRTRIEGLKIEASQHMFSFTISIGAHLPHTPQTPDATLQQVYHALYAAKEHGRNCVRRSVATGQTA